MAGERTATPSVGVMTTQFVSAAQLMARVLGAEGYSFVVIEHPVSSASVQALAERARVAARESAALLVAAPAA